MNITILDAFTVNPGDLDWHDMEQLGKLTLYDRTPPARLDERMAGSEAVFTNKVVLDRAAIGKCESLKFIGVLATGYNVVDTEAARERDIPVCNIPAYSTDSVTQWTMGHLVNLASRLSESIAAVRDGDWVTAPDFTFWRGPLVELAGKTLGIIGFGTIGRKVAAVAKAFGMTVVAYGPHLVPGSVTDGVEAVTLDSLLATSDFITLHCRLDASNRGMIRAEAIAKMKQGAFLINTARGPLLDERAVADALNSGRLAGLGCDVLSTEPPLPDNPLLTAKNCYMTPHNAWATREARKRLLAVAADNLRMFLAGTPRNVVNRR